MSPQASRIIAPSLSDLRTRHDPKDSEDVDEHEGFQHRRGYHYRTVFASQNDSTTQNIELDTVLISAAKGGKYSSRLHKPQR